MAMVGDCVNVTVQAVRVLCQRMGMRSTITGMTVVGDRVNVAV